MNLIATYQSHKADNVLRPSGLAIKVNLSSQGVVKANMDHVSD